jgi:hypothetical protein
MVDQKAGPRRLLPGRPSPHQSPRYGLARLRGNVAHERVGQDLPQVAGQRGIRDLRQDHRQRKAARPAAIVLKDPSRAGLRAIDDQRESPRRAGVRVHEIPPFPPSPAATRLPPRERIAWEPVNSSTMKAKQCRCQGGCKGHCRCSPMHGNRLRKLCGRTQAEPVSRVKSVQRESRRARTNPDACNDFKGLKCSRATIGAAVP